MFNRCRKSKSIFLYRITRTRYTSSVSGRTS